MLQRAESSGCLTATEHFTLKRIDLEHFPDVALSLLIDTLEEEVKQGSEFRNGEGVVGPSCLQGAARNPAAGWGSVWGVVSLLVLGA